MSTILKALKKAEDGRVKATLQDRLVAEEPPFPSGLKRAALVASAAVLASGIIATAVLLRVRPFEGEGSAPDSGPRTSAPSSPASDALLSKSDGREIPSLRLSGVIWDENAPLAIVNGRPVAPGEEVSGARVVKITMDGVTFRRGREEFALTVEE